MDNTSKFADFLNNPFTEEYLSYSESIIRYSVSVISALCETSGENSSKSSSEINDFIMNICCNLMRMVEFSTMLLNISSESNMNNNIIYVPEFIEKFSKSCHEVAGKEVRINFVCDDFCIATDDNVLIYFMLAFMRRTLLSYGGKANFELKGKCDGDKAEILLSTEPDRNEYYNDEVEYDFLQKYIREITDFISDKLGFRIEYDKYFIKIEIPAYKGKGYNDLRKRNIVYGKEMFSKFNIMLGDIPEIKSDI